VVNSAINSVTAYETITYDVSNSIARITLNRPEVMNGLNSQMRNDLLHAIKRAEDEARVIVTRGAGPNGCCGKWTSGGCGGQFGPCP